MAWVPCSSGDPQGRCSITWVKPDRAGMMTAMANGQSADPRLAEEFSRNRRKAMLIGGFGIFLAVGSLIAVNVKHLVPLERGVIRAELNLTILMIVGFLLWASQVLRCPSCKKTVRSLSARACPKCGILLRNTRMGERRGQPVHHNIHDPEFFKSYLEQISADTRAAKRLDIWGRVTLVAGPILFVVVASFYRGKTYIQEEEHGSETDNAPT